MFDLTKYSEQELEALRKAIVKEQRKREEKIFPYKVGDCFCDCEPTSHGKTWTIVRINEINGQVGYTGIYINATLDRNMFDSQMSFDYFKQCYRTPIDPSVFNVFHENAKAIEELKNAFMTEVFKLRKEYANKENK